jgi:hypothetical protein
MSTTDKIYNYEVIPPAGVWESIVAELNTNTESSPVIPIQKKRSKLFYYSIAAAACAAVIIFSVVLFNKHSGNTTGEDFFSSSSQNNIQNNSTANTDTPIKSSEHIIITVPTEDSSDNNVIRNKDDEKLLAQNSQSHGGPLEKKSKEGDDDKKSDSLTNTKDTSANETRPSVKPGEFLTIAGAEGQSIKVSSKASLLIDSSDNKIPPKLIWNKKIAQWREIMKGNTLAPTPGNFLDIIELTKTLKDK